MYDYIAYQKYRFSVRQHRWMMRNETLDESIAEPMQTLDLLCFSSQVRKRQDGSLRTMVVAFSLGCKAAQERLRL